MDQLVAPFADAIQTPSEFQPLIEEFRSVCREAAVNALEKNGRSSLEFSQLELETRFWSLVLAVYPLRLAAPAAGAEAQDSAILDWLRSTLDAVEESPDLTTAKWLYTRNETQQQGHLSELDADAPLRQNKPVNAKDKEADEKLFKYVFELLLRGDKDKVGQVCAQTNNWPLKAVVECSHRALAAQACYALAKTPSLGTCERAVYGLLAGDIESVLPLCTTWETQFVALLNGLVCAERYRSNTSEYQLDLPECPFKDVKSIVAELGHSSDHHVREQAQQPGYRLLAAVAGNTFAELCDELAAQLDEVAEGKRHDDVDSLALFTAVHLDISLGAKSQVGASATAQLVDAYVMVLEIKNAPHWIPGYLQYVEEPAQVRIYARVLAQLSMGPRRQLQLNLSRKLGLPVEQCVQGAVELIFQQAAQPGAERMSEDGDYFGQVQPPSDNPPTQVDLLLVSAVELLVSADMWRDAVHTAVAVLRMMLTAGRPEAVLELNEKVGLATLVENDRTETDAKTAAGAKAGASDGESDGQSDGVEDRHELEQYAKLVQALSSLQFFDESNASSAESVNRAVIAASTFFAGVRGAPGTRGEHAELLEELRTQYVPYILLRNVKVQRKARRFQAALGMANLVADENTRLYGLFTRSGRLREFLDACVVVEVASW